jgi:hypothetical protein
LATTVKIDRHKKAKVLKQEEMKRLFIAGLLSLRDRIIVKERNLQYLGNSL